MIKRRALIVGTMSAVAMAAGKAQSAAAGAQDAVPQRSVEPIVWPIVAKPQPGIRTFAGHTNTVPDVVQRDHKNEMAGGGVLAESGDVFSRRISALEIKDPVFHTGGARHAHNGAHGTPQPCRATLVARRRATFARAMGQGTMDGSGGDAARTAQAPDKAIPVKNAVSRRDSAPGRR